MYKIHDYKEDSKKINKIKRNISVILYIIIIPILIVNLTLIIKSFIKPNKIPDFFGYKNFIIVSKSMEPTIMVGDAIFMKDVDESEIYINDIISFHDGQDINTHRVIAISEENGIKYYTTKGDNNKREDKNKVTYKDIEGKYEFKISNFGIIVGILQSKITLLILVIIIIVNIYSNKQLQKKREERRKKRKQYEQSH